MDFEAQEGVSNTRNVNPFHAVKDLLQFQVALSRAVLEHRPINLEAMEMLGNALTRLGLHKEALAVDRQIVKLYPDNHIAHYNLACSYSNLGMIDEAFESLRRSVELGYADIKHMKKDPDLKKLRIDPRFTEILLMIRKHQQPYRSN
jgi:tetratricopeptide (TPR) repeat protein